MSKTSVSTAISYLRSLVQRAESTTESLCQVEVCHTKEQFYSLDALSKRLEEATETVAKQIQWLKSRQEQQTHEEGGRFILQVETTRMNIIENKEVKSIAAFRKSMTLIFSGPMDSPLDSVWDTSRNKQTRKRCEAIRELSPDGLVSWAAALAPSVWTASSMQNLVFDYLLGIIEPDDVQRWPPKMMEILHVFGVETGTPLSRSQEYRTFLEGEWKSF
jgi:hypothetical protein